MADHVYLVAKYKADKKEYVMTSVMLFKKEVDATSKVKLENISSKDDGYVWDWEIMFIH